MDEPTTKAARTGGCLCGNVRYKLEGKAATPLWNTICHCLNCRRRCGSAFYTASICPREGFSITSGADMIGSFTDVHTNSTAPLKRQWCTNCGSNMFNFTALMDDIVSISAGSLDDFDEWKPTLEQYCLNRADFVEKVNCAEKRFVRAHTGEVESD